MKTLFAVFLIQGFAVLLGLLKFISQKIMINILRFTYGSFLVFSGSVKILDPLGFAYKLQEYFEVFGMEWLVSLTLGLSIFICVFEIFVGLFLLCGIHVKKTMFQKFKIPHVQMY